MYQLKVKNEDETNFLPTGLNLIEIIDEIVRFHPYDVRVIDKEVVTSDTIGVLYAVDTKCGCKPRFTDAPTSIRNGLNQWEGAIIEAFDKLQT